MRTSACLPSTRLASSLAAAVVLSIGALSLPAVAATASATLTVNATVISSCAVSGSVLNFGNSIDPLNTAVPVDASTTMSVQCTNTTPYAVALNAGANAGGASVFANRKMKFNANALPYQLYSDSGHSTVWGDGTATSSTVTGTGSGGTQTLTVYGRIPSLTGLVPGAYTDTVTVTITY